MRSKNAIRLENIEPGVYMPSLLIAKGSFINKKPRITNCSIFLHASLGNVSEATNHKLIPVFTMNEFYE